jgi:hypothetical protein
MALTAQEKFADLFHGRLDAYGTDEGGCEKVVEGYTEAGWSKVGEYLRRIDGHLQGTKPMGVYPLQDDLTVWWGCTDLDNGEADLEHALNLRTLLEAGGVNAWVERSRSKGFHVWTFASQPIPADIMRNALLAAHQRLGIPAKEVNPKQVSMEGLKRGYGNYVRLPYPGADKWNGFTENYRQCVIDPNDTRVAPEGTVTLFEFVTEAHATRSPLIAYEFLAGKYIPPPPRTSVEVDTEHSAELNDLVAVMGQNLRCAFTYGPKEGHDRSSSLARMAYLAREDGLSASDAFMVMRDADRRWGKFFDRPDGDDQLLKMIERAYG